MYWKGSEQSVMVVAVTEALSLVCLDGGVYEVT